jgi:hypothetical protein
MVEEALLFSENGATSGYVFDMSRPAKSYKSLNVGSVLAHDEPAGKGTARTALTYQ